MSATVIAGVITGSCAIAAAIIAAFAKKNPKNVSGARVKWPGNATSITVSDSATASNIAVGDNITQTFSAENNNFFSIVAPSVGKKPSKPSPVEIVSVVKSSKPFDRLQIVHNYEGIEVSWPCTFRTIYQLDGDKFMVCFDSLPTDDTYNLRENIAAIVKIKRYPRLKIISMGHPAWIEGRISQIDIVNTIIFKDDPKIILD